ncbi:MAG: right-handed parallel beta-helix repeat-containing protein [Pirellulales bacterium]
MIRPALIIGLILAGHAAPAATLFVATTGNDTHPGTAEEPFATLERARDAIRKRKPTSSQPVTVTVRAGTYRFGATFTLTADDSGTSSAPVVWQAAEGEVVRLTGGVTLPADAFRPVTEEAVLTRIDASARRHVLQIDLHGLGVDRFGSYPQRFRGAPAVPELFVDDQRLTLARWPNDGWATIAKIIDSGTSHNSKPPPRPGVFEFSGDHPARWNVKTGVWLLGYWCYDWHEETIQVHTIDVDRHRITLSQPTVYGIKQGNPSPRRYRALNLLEELDQPGEYYIDRAAGRLYVWPPADIAHARIVLSTLNGPIISVQDAEYVTFHGFIVEASLGDGIDVTGGRAIHVERCVVRNTRQLGIRVRGGVGHRVGGCDIHDTGTGGLVLQGGDRKRLTPAGHLAVDNRIWRFSQHQLTYASGITLSGVGNRAAHNQIHDAPHMAVAIAGNDHLFEYNIVHDVCTASDDAGALYKGRNPSCRGNMIRYNLWRDIGSPMGHGTAAIYFDDGDGGDTVFGNIFVRCGYPGRGSFGTVFSHGGHDNIAENNIFVDCPRALGSAPWNDKRWQETIAGGHGCHWQQRLLRDVDITQPPYTTQYPALAGFMAPQPDQPRVNRAKNNVLVRCAETSSGNWHYAPDEMWVTDADPGFVDAAAGNYQLRPDAEVFTRLPGFRPIPVNKIGPRGDWRRP